MTLISLARVIKFAFISFWRNIWLSTATTLIMILTLFSLTAIYILNVVSGIALDTLKEKVDVSLYLNPQASENQVNQIKDELLAMPEVSEVDYKSQQQALEEFKSRHQDNQLIISSLQELADNPLQPTLIVKATNSEDYQNIISKVESGKYGQAIEKVSYEDNREVIEKLSSTTDSIKRVGYIIIAVFSLIVALVIFNTIRLTIYTQRDEIKIMKLVGATNMFVRLPYLIEGVIYGLLASIFSTIISYAAIYYFAPSINSFLGGNTDIFSYFVGNFFYIIGLQILFGSFLGALSGYIAIRKYLRV